MQIVSDCLLEEFGNNNYMFGTYVSLSNKTRETFLRLSGWWVSIDSSTPLNFSEILRDLKKFELN